MGEGVVSYLDHLIYYLFLQSEVGVFHPHMFYVRLFIILCGSAMCILFIAGVCRMLLRYQRYDFLFFCPVVIVLGLLSLKTRGNFIRYISLAVPFFCVIAAWGMDALIKILRFSRVRFIFVCAVLFVSAFECFKAASAFVGVSSGYDEMKNYLMKNNGERHLATINSFSEFYFGRNVADKLPSNITDALEVLRSGNFKYVVLDFMAHRAIGKTLKEVIENKCVPAVSFNNEIGTNFFIAVESLGYGHLKPGYLRNALSDSKSKKINVYFARDVLQALELYNTRESA